MLRVHSCPSVVVTPFSMSDQSNYAINLEVKFKPLELIDIQTLVDECEDKWYNQTLCQVNDCVIRSASCRANSR